MIDLGRVLRYAVERGASDVHLKVPSPPAVRVHGLLQRIPKAPPLKPADTERFLQEMLGPFPDKLEEFRETGGADFSHARDGLGRFRVNAFRQRGSVSFVMRAVPFKVPELHELNLPPAVVQLSEEERGIVLVTGTTGSGKSTTLGAMIDHINRRQRKHIVTIEDPIEILHTDRLSMVNQREVGLDTPSFADAMRRVMRQDPDVILIGEIRDLVTMETALNAAETGHLVFSTLHTLDAPETINRAIGFFPLHQQQQVRAMLAGTLKGILSQRLVQTFDGAGRVPAVEVMITTGRARDFILDADQTGLLHEVIRDGEYYGMQTFDQSLFGHVKSGMITIDEAMRAATSPHDFKLMLESGQARRGDAVEVPNAVQTGELAGKKR
ncbi:MAG TPA: PilT/PilU family type 4a pilus ATPase [Miltoncostaeaceae bacterium]|nr:PilT/PilU family type 4a pilus ATPase [Miltoncostaeaceae bacterium]